MSVALRRAAVAGTWYPGNPRALAADVEEYLAAAEVPAVPGRLVGLVSPHAGLVYSGPVAAYGYSLLRGRRDVTLVLVGPSHRAAFEGASVWPRGQWETPFGPLPIDEDLAARLLETDVVRDLPGPHVPEHSLEMQLPFVAHLVPGLRLVPLLLGDQGRDSVAALAHALGESLVGRDDALLAASSDLSHYHAAPHANALDARVVKRVGEFDEAGLMDLLEENREHACGGGAIVAVMRAARRLGADRATVLRYADSGDAGGYDKSRVVGYLSAALSQAA